MGFLILIMLGIGAAVVVHVRGWLLNSGVTSHEALTWIGQEWSGLLATFIVSMIGQFFYALSVMDVDKTDSPRFNMFVNVSFGFIAACSGFLFALSCLVNLIIFAKA
jgi:hypothetical protein